ncbi:MAG: TonB family protein [Steroidobacteraceae bacterium]
MLTRDAALIAAVRAAIDAEHRVTVVAGDAALIDHLMASPLRAALIDCAATAQPIAQVTERLLAQFPDLVLVVAGTAGDQGALAAQITDGRVFRFLHKPVSAQRVKLFIESAFRRSDVVPSQWPATPAPAGTRAGRARVPLIAGGLAVAALAAAAIWWATRDTPAAPHDRATANRTASAPAPAPAPASAAVLADLERADAALARGALLAPPGESAADLYRQALTRSPGNARAIAGLDAVVDRIVGDAEQAIAAGRIDEAAGLVDRARGVRADHPRVAYLATQIAKERERVVLAAARQAAASGNLDRAISVLDSGQAGGSELIGAARRELRQREIDARIASLLALAAERVQSGALLEPAGDSARFYIESVRALAPDHPDLPAAADTLRAALTGEARRAIATGDFAAAERWVAAAEANQVARAGITALRHELQAARITRRADDLATLATRFDESLRRKQLLEPPADSARALYLAMRAVDAEHPSTLAARDALGRELLAASRGALARADADGAERYVAGAEAIGLADIDVSNAKRDIATLRAQERAAATVVSAGRLTRTRTVEPRYPADARAGGITGWVDLEFIVAPDGSVADVRVTGASPPGVFDDSAQDALARWRFEPVMRNGVAVSQRARLRVRFDLE